MTNSKLWKSFSRSITGEAAGWKPICQGSGSAAVAPSPTTAPAIKAARNTAVAARELRTVSPS
jgi:hypothetical protein